MSDTLIKELTTKVDEFFAKATNKDIKRALKEAGYQAYTGVDPDNLVLRKSKSTYNAVADNYWFSYNVEVKYSEASNYVVCFDCYAFDVTTFDAPYKKAA